MIFTPTFINDLYIAELEPHKDKRGSFMRGYCYKEFQKYGIVKNISQVNHSITLKKGTIRGLHYQTPPFSESKIVQCLIGKVWDVVVDIRKDSPHFLTWFAQELSPENKKVMIIPEGFAHGFQTLQDNSQLIYLHTEQHNPSSEKGIPHNDPSINIQWPIEISELSQRDRTHSALTNNFSGVQL